MPRAVAYALTDKQLAKLDDLVGDDDAVLDFVNDLEEVWDTKNLVEFDKAWDAMHRCLTDGELLYENGEFPLSYCVLGGERAYMKDDWSIIFKSCEQVQAISKALEGITKGWFEKRYKTIKGYAAEWGPDDFEYTWANLIDVRAFYVKAAAAGRSVLFTVDC